MTRNKADGEGRIEVGDSITVARYGGRRFGVEETTGETDDRLLLRPQELRSTPEPRFVSRAALRRARADGDVEVV